MASESTSEDRPRAWVDIDLGALVRNARVLILQARAPLVPMVKADAYGLGAVRVAMALEAVQPMAFGVSSVAEGEELRAAGITRPIILFTPSAGDPSLLAKGITPTLARAEDITAWGRASGNAAYHLAIDTGMHRAGIDHTLLSQLRDAVTAFPPAGAFTHFHSAELDDGSMEIQEERFRAAVAQLPARPALLHMENSAAIVRRSPSEWDCVRPGVFLYGIGSGPKVAVRPEPVVQLRARILELRTVPNGESVSYDATWRAQGPRRIATVACGYADGLRRQLGNVGAGLLHGARVPIAGVITMDMTMLDVTSVECAVGDVVTFIGSSGDALWTAEQAAAAGGLSPYELLTGLRQRLPRFYVGAE